MKLKALIEKRNQMLDELDQIASAVETEVRGLTEDEDSRVAVLTGEIESLDKAIKFAETRSSKDVEIIEDKGEERSVEKDLQFEVRAVEQFLRGQDGEEIREIRANAAPVQTGSNPGAITIPTHLSTLIVEKLYEVASLFSRTRNFTPVAGVLEVLREQDHGTAGFVGELTDLETSNFAMDKVRLTQKRAGTAIELSQHIINDSGIDVVNYAVGLLSKRLAMTLDRNILVGTGDAQNQFEGMLGHADIDDVETAVAGAIGTDDLVDLYNSVHPDYQAGSVFVMNRNTFNTLVKLKDANNHYYFIRDITAGAAGYRLFGLPVLIIDAMPEIAEGNQAVLMANFNEAYATMTKKGLNMQHITGDSRQALRGAHLLLLDGYFDGKVLNPNAAKFLKVKATA
jgi:HK97 family phage major capsid protein